MYRDRYSYHQVQVSCFSWLLAHQSIWPPSLDHPSVERKDGSSGRQAQRKEEKREKRIQLVSIDVEHEVKVQSLANYGLTSIFLILVRH